MQRAQTSKPVTIVYKLLFISWPQEWSVYLLLAFLQCENTAIPHTQTVCYDLLISPVGQEDIWVWKVEKGKLLVLAGESRKLLWETVVKKAFSINTDKLSTCTLWIYIWTIQTNSSQSQSKKSLFKLGWSRGSNNFSLHSFQDSNIYAWEQYHGFK